MLSWLSFLCALITRFSQKELVNENKGSFVYNIYKGDEPETFVEYSLQGPDCFFQHKHGQERENEVRSSQSGNDVMDEGDKCLFWGSNQRDKKSLKTHFEVIFWRMNIYFLLG